MIEIYKFTLGQLQANCYLLVNDKDCLIIDPGDDVPFLLEEIQRKRLKLVGMLATHGHFDHVGAVGEIQLSFNVPLYIFKEDQFLIDRLGETAKYFLGHDPHFIAPKNINYLNIENSFQISSASWRIKFQILFTPGHTPGGCCFYFPEENALFTGDTLFKGAVGRYDFSYCNKKNFKNSLMALFKLPEETIIYPGHGEETTIKKEKDNLLHFINRL